MNIEVPQQKPAGVVGIYLHKPKHAVHMWIGRIWVKGKCSQVPGRYKDPIEAHNARCDYMAKLGMAAPAKIVEAA